MAYICRWRRIEFFRKSNDDGVVFNKKSSDSLHLMGIKYLPPTSCVKAIASLNLSHETYFESRATAVCVDPIQHKHTNQAILRICSGTQCRRGTTGGDSNNNFLGANIGVWVEGGMTRRLLLLCTLRCLYKAALIYSSISCLGVCLVVGGME